MPQPLDPDARPTRVSFGPFIGEDPLDIATTTFTVLSITPAGALAKSNSQPDTVLRRTNAILQDVTHIDFATVTSIATSHQPANGVSMAFLDYIKLLGSINTGNQYTAAATDLTIAKAAGTTNLPFLNGAFSLTNPNEQVNAAADPTGFVQSFIDGLNGLAQQTQRLPQRLFVAPLRWHGPCIRIYWIFWVGISDRGRTAVWQLKGGGAWPLYKSTTRRHTR